MTEEQKRLEEEKKKNMKSSVSNSEENQAMSDLTNYYSDAPTGITSNQEWFNRNQNYIEQNKQKQLEDTYVQRELLNKYLAQDQQVAGLSGSGIAQLYAQQSNVDYMNQRANINSDYQAQALDLYNQYYAKEQAEQAAEQAEQEENQKNMYNMYLNTADSLRDGYGNITKEQAEELLSRIDSTSIGDTNMQYFNEYLNSLIASEEELASIQNDKHLEEQQAWFNTLYGSNGSDGTLASELYKLDDNGDGKLTDEQIGMLKEYVNGYGNNIDSGDLERLNKVIDSYTMTEKEKSLYSLEVDKEYIKSNYVGVDASNPIDPKEATVTSFGTKFKDAGKGTHKGQDKYVETILSAVKNDKDVFKNGALINFDFGNQQAKGNSVYMYYNGRFYKTNKRPSEANIDSDNINDNINISI